MLLRPRRRARHAKPVSTAPTLAVLGMTAVVLGGFEVAPASAAVDDFARLRACESGGNYRAATGNGFYGAYQFDLRTWRGLGLGGRPSDAAPATQDAAARRLQAARGWQPWPACARLLGLTGRAAAPRSMPVVASRSRRVAGRQPAPGRLAAPPFGGRLVTVADAGQRRADVAVWQRRMTARGWELAADGHFGPRSSAVAARFAAEKRLRVARPGTLDVAVWRAAWMLPVT